MTITATPKEECHDVDNTKLKSFAAEIDFTFMRCNIGPIA